MPRTDANGVLSRLTLPRAYAYSVILEFCDRGMHGKAVKIRHCPATVSGVLWREPVTARVGRLVPSAPAASQETGSSRLRSRTFRGRTSHMKTRRAALFLICCGAALRAAAAHRIDRAEPHGTALRARPRRPRRRGHALLPLSAGGAAKTKNWGLRQSQPGGHRVPQTGPGDHPDQSGSPCGRVFNACTCASSKSTSTTSRPSTPRSARWATRPACPLAQTTLIDSIRSGLERGSGASVANLPAHAGDVRSWPHAGTAGRPDRGRARRRI